MRRFAQINVNRRSTQSLGFAYLSWRLNKCVRKHSACSGMRNFAQINVNRRSTPSIGFADISWSWNKCVRKHSGRFAQINAIGDLHKDLGFAYFSWRLNKTVRKPSACSICGVSRKLMLIGDLRLASDSQTFRGAETNAYVNTARVRNL